MSRAYDEIYLEDAMRNLGASFEYAKRNCHIELDDFYILFLNSGIAHKFETGDPKYIIGMSGVELALKVLGKEDSHTHIDGNPDYGYSCEYWCGWMLAYVQWYFGIRFKYLHYYLKMTDLERLYAILHETSERKALEVICENIRNKDLESRLQQIRIKNGLSQKQLAVKSDVSLRIIQQYEQKKRDINKASVSSLLSVSRVLNCDIEDLMEWDFVVD